MVDDVPATAGDEITFHVPLRLREGGDWGGPYVQGARGERFVYLCWGERTEAGAWDGFRRAKIPLSGITAATPGATVEAHLRLTDARGGPACATLKAPAVEWAKGPGAE